MEKGRPCRRPSVFPSVARPVAVRATSRASRACQEECFPKGRSAGTTLRNMESLDIGSPPFSSLNTAPMWGPPVTCASDIRVMARQAPYPSFAPPLTWQPPSSPRGRGEEDCRERRWPSQPSFSPCGRRCPEGADEGCWKECKVPGRETPRSVQHPSSDFASLSHLLPQGEKGRRDVRTDQRNHQCQPPSPRLRGEDAGRHMRGSADLRR
jgi:hypothetical protein